MHTIQMSDRAESDIRFVVQIETDVARREEARLCPTNVVKLQN